MDNAISSKEQVKATTIDAAQSSQNAHTSHKIVGPGSSHNPSSVHETHAEQIHAVRIHKLSPEQAQEISSLFAILKDPTRLQVLYTLLHAPQQELCVSDIAYGLQRDDTTISHQLRLLRTQRVVAMRKEGRVAYYHLIDDHIKMLLELALSHICEEPQSNIPH
ncbi:helix-turn-helix transcriptional regulator [Ktedonobacteria bacterium brp13]|nr:helix-turn-helix transcriptional regulator [Ktedonobacteria bacterium brp13]